MRPDDVAGDAVNVADDDASLLDEHEAIRKTTVKYQYFFTQKIIANHKWYPMKKSS
jgi:hypothetical protein